MKREVDWHKILFSVAGLILIAHSISELIDEITLWLIKFDDVILYLTMQLIILCVITPITEETLKWYLTNRLSTRFEAYLFGLALTLVEGLVYAARSYVTTWMILILVLRTFYRGMHWITCGLYWRTRRFLPLFIFGHGLYNYLVSMNMPAVWTISIYVSFILPLIPAVVLMMVMIGLSFASVFGKTKVLVEKYIEMGWTKGLCFYYAIPPIMITYAAIAIITLIYHLISRS